MIKLEGISELTEAIKKALLEHPENDVRNALKRSANVIGNDAKNRVTINNSVKSGALRDSIKILPKWKGDPTGVYIGPRVRRRRKAKEGQRQDPYYAHWVEYGTTAHNLGYKGKFVEVTGENHPGSRPKPYMRPAFDSKAGGAMQAALEDMAKMIEK